MVHRAWALADIDGSGTVEVKHPMPVQVALAIIAGAAQGLAHAHERCAADGRSLGLDPPAL